MDKIVSRAIDRMKELYQLDIRGEYDSTSDDMTGRYIINGKRTDIPYPCSQNQLYDALYYTMHCPNDKRGIQVVELFEIPSDKAAELYAEVIAYRKWYAAKYF